MQLLSVGALEDGCKEKESTVMIDKGTAVLQNHMDPLKFEPSLISETCPASSHNGDRIISMKVKEASDTQKVADPLLITFPEIKDERKVSYMSACPQLGKFQKYTELGPVFLIPICLFT